MTEYFKAERRLPAGFDLEGHVARLEADGYTIIEDFMCPDHLRRFREGLAPQLGTYRGRNSFEGFTTERVYTLVGRGEVYEETASDHRLLAILDRLLLPNYLLSADHAICIYPGEKAQNLHTDDPFYPFPRPRRAFSISTIGAIDAFTPQNGGTVMYRGSHKWSFEEIEALRASLARGEVTEATQRRFHLTMPAGALCIFQGTLVHSGGANVSDAPRLAFTNQYCEPWARPQENFFLGIPKERVRRMSREMQILLGYELRRPNDIMGQVGGYHPIKTLDPDFVLPVLR
ncbi:MAG TPA: phytanoyl-CoA dioxygenase family protein [Caulobacteraceae bacterium]|jgi:ectoine hydroxylase-related dioxygenase (phytanoyl-CoA dioxygenase family)|nr:phytanoyl-CoA dioxygenase family protein [Caulobacteraceae bacterium]